MKPVFYIALLATFSFQLHAQIHQGVVLDATTHKPIADVNIFINGTTIGTSTDNKGNFYLHGFPTPPYEIHISAIGYETGSYKITDVSDYKTIAILLEQKPWELTEAVISAPAKNGWKTYGWLFIGNFIGHSSFSEQCKINNPEVVQFIYDNGDSVLRIYAEAPLIITNDALGYKITYWLHYFTYDEKTRVVSYEGISHFKDLITETTRKNKIERWNKNRVSAYNGSFQHFATSLYHNRTEKEGFDVKPTERAEGKDFAESINPYTFIRLTSENKKVFEFENYLQITYSDKNLKKLPARVRNSLDSKESRISLYQVSEVTLYPNGIYEPAYGIIFVNGAWARQKLDYLLPLNYLVDTDL
jgi:hypothetical protein